MPVTTLATANEILNRVAAEVGIEPIADPYSSPDPSYKQMQYLLNVAGEELLMAYNWELLSKEVNFTTADTDTGDYDLPDDFFSMTNQTQWDRTNNVPLYGPLSPQDWQYLEGRDLVTQTIYASYRLDQGKFRLFPQPPPNGLEIYYEYTTKNWVQDGTDPLVLKDHVEIGADVPLYDKTLISRYLKVKFLEAKGFDSTKAQTDFNQVFSALTGKDKSADTLSAGRGYHGYPYLDSYRNVGDSGYGTV